MKIYAAVGKVITDIYWNGLPKTSEALEVFFVKPEIIITKLGIKRITGFKEIKTGDKIINRNYYVNEFDNLEYYDMDIMIHGKPQIGDVVWELIVESKFDEILTPEEIQKYKSFSKNEIREQLKSFREEARKIVESRENLELKHNKRYK